MTIVKRLRLLTAVLGAAAASAVVGTTVFGDGFRPGRPAPPDPAAVRRADAAAADANGTRFSTLPALAYRAKNGATTFAWQLKPAVAAGPARDRDLLVMVDTSASQGGEPLKRARQIINGLSKAAGPNDRIDVWTVNLNTKAATRSLTGGFQPAGSDAVQSAAARLVESEYAAGATDLSAGVEAAVAAFDGDAGRNRAVVFLGDGESAASPTPLTEEVRVRLGAALDAKNVGFFAVPLGIKVNAHNLHGLASLTGGAVVRLTEDLNAQAGRAAFAGRLVAAIDVPVLKPAKAEYGPGIGEVFPAKLPPLRADRPTLVVGTLTGPAAALGVKVTGTVAGVPTIVELAEPVPAADAGHYFLHAMLEQWRTAPTKDAPAILAADRALALAAQQFRLFREEFLTQAVMAITADKYDHAEKLFEAARKIDPDNGEADAGLKVVAKMRAGQLTRQQVRAELAADRARLGGLARQDPAQPPAGGAKPAAPPAVGAPVAPAPGGLVQAQAERAVLEQQFRVLVDETIRRARALYPTDPDTAYEDLKRQRDAVVSNAALSDAFRSRLAADLEGQMQTIATQGATIKRLAAEERARIAATRLRINEYERQQSIEQSTAARIDAFKQLMNQARYELAQQESQILIQERVSRGQTVPPEATAAYMIGQSAANLREHRELVRLREDRYLLAMMQTEKSFVPYPDEPPVHFPPAAVWRELTADRAKYSSSALGSEVSPSQMRIQSIIDGPNAQRIQIEQELEGMELKDFLGLLEKNHGLQFFVLEDEFKQDGEAAILAKKLGVKQRLTGLTVGAALDIALPSIGATYVVRPEYIEITTFNKRLKEKVVRAFQVSELVYSIPSSVNQATLRQNQNVQTTNLQLFGQATFAGGFGAIGGLGLGGLGGLGLGGLGGLGGGGLGGLGGGGLGGAGGLGAGIGGQGGFGGGAANNLGFGGGVIGVGGGQQGQFGNLGGQFGIQGNDLVNYQVIARLIQEVVAKGEWADLAGQFRITTQQPGMQGEDESKILPEDQLNSLAYYPPARALIVRGTGKYHPQTSYKLRKAEGAAAPVGNPAKGGAQVAAAGGAKERDEVAAVMKKIDKTTPLKMWQQAMEQSKVTDPGLVVACADFLFEAREPGHAAEILKAGVRTGLTTDRWAHDALHLALKASKAAAEDVQRVGFSGVDLEPTDARAYLAAARAADEAGQPAAAVAYCKRAAALEPNLPVAYADALGYAEKAGGRTVEAVHWATDNLLRRDWTSDATDYHAEATRKLTRIVDEFRKAGQPAEAERFQKVLDADARRDLVVELLWQGKTADLDLYVTEPTGSTAGPAHKRTAGGGVLKADVLDQGDDRSEVYTAAEAFSGGYEVRVKPAFGRAVGGRAQVRVTRFKGTDREAVEQHSIDLANPQPVRFTLDGGSRTELVDLTLIGGQPAAEAAAAGKLPTVAEVLSPTHAVTGLSASPFGRAAAGNRPAGPVTVRPQETVLPAVGKTGAALRAVMDLTPDRKGVKITVNPVFSGTAADVPLPTVSLLPGGGQ
jgi:tetratricopeptide (TPR) repeat protein